ncbi:MAG: imidazolonepropionase [Legionellaceae bacterium]|nr:imidazolonepropionase [Legionellaceae bacterium]
MVPGVCLTNLQVLTPTGAVIAGQTVVVQQDQIVWVGPDAQLPAMYQRQDVTTYDGQNRLLTPALIDCHSHLIYGGNRAHEFRSRLAGQSYADIAAAGGGIRATVQATREASAEALLHAALPRALALRAEGVATLEIKSGYGLDLASEVKMLQVARQLGEHSGMRIRSTFLGAHALPPEYEGRSQAYIDYLCAEMLPYIAEAKLADAVDVFCETIAFSRQQAEQVFQTAIDYGLPIKCHAEQLSNMGASQLAATMGALSCDHLEYLDEAGLVAMQQQGTVAVLLPGAFYYLAETRLPPVAALRAHQIPMAIATDANPGSSPTSSLLLMLSMACRFFGLTVDEALAAVTCNAARALGLADDIGMIAPKRQADLIVWDIADPAELCYYFASPLAHQTMIGGSWLDEPAIPLIS